MSKGACDWNSDSIGDTGEAEGRGRATAWGECDVGGGAKYVGGANIGEI